MNNEIFQVVSATGMRVHIHRLRDDRSDDQYDFNCAARRQHEQGEKKKYPRVW